MEPHLVRGFRDDANVGKFQHAATRFPGRPGLNTSGKQIQIRVNQFKISQVPSRNIYQYDVLVGTGAEKRGSVKAVWECNTVRSRLRSAIQGPWLWNGDKVCDLGRSLRYHRETAYAFILNKH
jgi:eukaryotic translation initiation factor 2C